MPFEEYRRTFSAHAQWHHSQARSPAYLAIALLLFALCAAGRASAQSGSPAPPTGHRLVGTVEGVAFSGAVLVDASGEQKFFRLNETLPDGSRLYKLKNDSILIKQTDGAVSEVFVFHELRAAIPVGREPAVNAKPNARTEAPTRRQRPIRHQSPMYDEDGQ